MMPKFLFATLFAAISHNLAACADAPFTCRVVDTISGEPLPFANIVVEGTNTGSVANEEGVFMLDISGLASEQIIAVSHLSYETKRLTVAALDGVIEIALRRAAIDLREVTVGGKQPTGEQIMAWAEDHFERNYSAFQGRQRVFYHHFERTPSPGKNALRIKRSDFPGMDKALMEEVMATLPPEFVTYQGLLADFHTHSGKQKLLPVRGISREEGHQEKFEKESEEKLSTFFNEIDKKPQEGIYYKLKTGILSFKLNDESEDSTPADTINTESEPEPDHLHEPTEYTKMEINKVMHKFTHYDNDAWEFVTSRGKYRYTLEQVTVLDGQLVYQVAFTPRWRGLYEGKAYVHTEDFAILMADFAFASGKEGDNIQMLGVGHAVRNQRVRFMFERFGEGYALKYIHAKEHEYWGVERTFCIVKKQKRWLFDKELAELKVVTDLKFDTHREQELLVMEREVHSKEAFDALEEPKTVPYKRETNYDPAHWDDQTIIAPSESLKAYRRK